MVKLTTSDLVREYIDKHPTATTGDVHKALEGKVSYNYIGKLISIYRKKTKQKRVKKNVKKSRNPKSPPQKKDSYQDSSSSPLLDPELENIFGIMEAARDRGLPVPRLKEVHEYLSDRGSLTNAEEIIKSQVQAMPLHELTQLILPEKKSQKEPLEEN